MPTDKHCVALVYAPFGACHSPALGISLIKSALARKDIPCDIHYLNLMLAQEIGVRIFDLISSHLGSVDMVGEWLFAPALLGENTEADTVYLQEVLWGKYRDTFTPAIVRELLRIRDGLPAFLDACLERVNWAQYDWVGFSSSFHQNCASLALAQRIKSRFPNPRIVFGGANCLGEIGAALSRLFPFVDFVCTGRGEKAFPSLIQAVADGDAAPSIPGMIGSKGEINSTAAFEPARAEDLNQLPYPDFSDYFEQLKTFQEPSTINVVIYLEASLGCWWGEKTQCTFCGLNATELGYRYKTPERLLDEIRYVSENYGNQILFTDNILAQSYFQTVLPELARQPGISMGFDVRVNLRHDQVELMADAGVKCIQVGIESLSDPLLRLMRKGTTVAQNIQILKWAKQFGIEVFWNLLCGFPGEDPAEYEAIQRLIPLLTHLDPPFGGGHIHFDRFSAYWADPASYGITRLRPSCANRTIYHILTEEDLNQMVYHFDAEYVDVSDVFAKDMEQAVNAWRACTNAALDVFPSPHSVSIVDTRQGCERREYSFNGVAAELYLLCDTAQTVRALMQAPSIVDRADEAEVVSILDQFVEQGLMIHTGRLYLSLAVIRESKMINLP